MELTHFQRTVRLALGLTDEEAANVQPQWPKSEDALVFTLDRWIQENQSQVTGLQILTACPQIWRYKPEDLAEAAGREILYHPITGDPIPENAPLDKLSWEILAILRWANKMSHLPWHDEVIISREIKKAGNNFNDWPVDRYFFIQLLPVTQNGIDWSDVELAKAKQWTIKGPDHQTFDAPDNFPATPLSNTLENVLCSIPSLGNEGTRSLLLRGQPPGPAGVISRSSAPITDINNIVWAVRGYGRLNNGRPAINVLIDNAIRLVRGTQLENQLRKFKEVE